jgi:hypothetical protein
MRVLVRRYVYKPHDREREHGRTIPLAGGLDIINRLVDYQSTG